LNSNQQQRLSIISETPAPFALSTFIQPDEQQLSEKKKKNPFLSVDDLEESESFNFQPKKLLPSQSFQSGDCVYATSLQPYVLGQEVFCKQGRWIINVKVVQVPNEHDIHYKVVNLQDVTSKPTIQVKHFDLYQKQEIIDSISSQGSPSASIHSSHHSSSNNFDSTPTNNQSVSLTAVEQLVVAGSNNPNTYL
jgi:hypothetical protein